MAKMGASSTAPRGRAARVALQTGAVADHGEVAAFGAGLADVAFHARFGAALGDLLVCRGGGAERQRRRLGELTLQRGCALDVALRARTAGGLDGWFAGWRPTHQHQLVGLRAQEAPGDERRSRGNARGLLRRLVLIDAPAEDHIADLLGRDMGEVVAAEVGDCELAEDVV